MQCKGQISLLHISRALSQEAHWSVSVGEAFYRPAHAVRELGTI